MVSLLILWPFLYFNRRVFTCNEVVLVINTLLLPFFFKDELKQNFNFFLYLRKLLDGYFLFIFLDGLFKLQPSRQYLWAPIWEVISKCYISLYLFVSGKEKHRNKIQILPKTTF